ncbi:hypothetical protein TNIN_237331 [Trichonephila inaurata madagascariensis]|uniref:Uncharacterized protein n=1 Tax=Trichonephila inaurata madagascariensis TaxID=2747483 RepID=A0A8X6Y808_9ARAC|nr:hypothetical protein TNIN_237331 [Trichonephila inaurata madagascariensis]
MAAEFSKISSSVNAPGGFVVFKVKDSLFLGSRLTCPGARSGNKKVCCQNFHTSFFLVRWGNSEQEPGFRLQRDVGGFVSVGFADTGAKTLLNSS